MIGILLAAGIGRRFDAAGQANKLMQPLPHGQVVAVASARPLLRALPTVIAVVRNIHSPLAQVLEDAGCQIVACARAQEGMGASLVCGIQASLNAKGWLIALADMPYIQDSTVLALSQAVENGAGIAAPYCAGRRGNPVAFGSVYRDHLLQLKGDQGARTLLQREPVCHVAVQDPGIFLDIDTPSDLLQGYP